MITGWKDDPFAEIPRPCPFCGCELDRNVDEEGAYFTHPELAIGGYGLLRGVTTPGPVRGKCMMSDITIVDGSGDVARWNRRPSFWQRVYDLVLG